MILIGILIVIGGLALWAGYKTNWNMQAMLTALTAFGAAIVAAFMEIGTPPA